jgi:very-short-patch-repair endonuclease
VRGMPNQRVRQLRVDATDAERRLWGVLRDRRLAGFKFRRQHRLGPFIVDFICFESRLVIEADGGQHVDNAYDERRTAWLEQRGWRVIRFWNTDILTNIDGVQEMILGHLRNPHPPDPKGSSPSLSRKRERGSINE